MKKAITANEELNSLCGTENIDYFKGDTALGFLFKYAVPALRKYLKDDTLVMTLLKDWAVDFILDNNDPAEALAQSTLEVLRK